MSVGPFDFGNAVKEAVESAMRELRVVNVLIVGRTGVGKSTLINAVFNGNLAETGQGRPVTHTTREYSKEGLPLRVFDTRGLELAAYEETLRAVEKLVADRRRDRDADRHIHVAWVCISEDSRRVEQAEIDVVEMLGRHDIPTVGVITKSRADRGFRHVVQELLPAASNVVRVRAEAEEFDDGHTLAVLGLVDLVEVTAALVPASHRRAFVAAQKASIEQKVLHAHGVVVTAAASAAAAAAIPIPVADAVLIVPIQIGMIAGVSATFGLELNVAIITTLVLSAMGAGGAVLMGRMIAGELFKLLPGVGAIAGGAINAATAATLTAALGETYILTLKALYTLTDAPSPEAVVEEFKRQLKARSVAGLRR